MAGINVEDPKKESSLCVSRYSKHSRPWTADGYVLVDSKLAAGQADRLSIQREIELNRVPVVRVQRRLPQRAYSAISRGGDDQCGCVDAAGASHRHAEQSDSCRHRDR